MPHPAFAWGDKGHEIIALIAQNYLSPVSRAKVILLLAGNTDTLTDHDIAAEPQCWARLFFVLLRTPRNRKFADSALEECGFELAVPGGV